MYGVGAINKEQPLLNTHPSLNSEKEFHSFIQIYYMIIWLPLSAKI